MAALLIIDVQNDFLPNGALPVPEGNQVIPVANAMMKKPFDLVLASKDWHPANHQSFASNHAGKKPGDLIDLDGLEQILWPVHCVEGTPGSDFAPGLNVQNIQHICYKGTDPLIDSYSAFFDNGYRKPTGLSDYLKEKGIKELYILGLATDYCVKFSVFDALRLGFHVHLIRDGCRGIDLQPGDCERAIEEMRAAGAHITDSK